jgi:hypothetical protein
LTSQKASISFHFDEGYQQLAKYDLAPVMNLATGLNATDHNAKAIPVSKFFITQYLPMKLSTSLFTTVASSLAVASIALSAAQAPAAAANLVQNGSFEETNVGSGWGLFSEVPGWKSTAGYSIEVQGGVAGQAYKGQNLVEIDSHYYNNDPNATLGLFQDIQTVVGQTYNLSFMFSPRPGTSLATNPFKVLFGSYEQLIEPGAGGSQTNWQKFATSVVATSTTTRLQFNLEGTRDYLGGYIDDVQLEAVPEPATMAGLAIFGLGLVAAKKRKAAQ